MSCWFKTLPPRQQKLILFLNGLDYNPYHNKSDGRFARAPDGGSTGGHTSHGRNAPGVYVDVTDEYRRNATPGVGRFEVEEGVDLDKQKDEIEIAKWLLAHFGGDIMVLRERNEKKGERNPDYLWRGRLWDLKTPDEPSFNATNKRIQTGLHQIEKNPGGVIVDLRKCGATIEEAERAIVSRMRTSGKFPADIIVLVRGREYKILRFK